MNRGACGVAVVGDLASAFAPLDAAPLVTARCDRVDKVPVPPEATTVWDVEVHQRQRLLALDGHRWLEVDGWSVLGVDLEGAAVSCAATADDTAAQLVAGLALPLLARAAGADIVHAAAVAGAAGALLLVGDSGTGKSSLLAALVGAGWTAVTEDTATVAAAGVWPGPPWVRLASDPGGLDPLHRTPEKVAYDLEPVLTRGPVPVAAVVVIDEPSEGPEPRWVSVERAVAVGALARHIVWLDDPADRAAGAFAAAARLARTAPLSRVSFPRRDDWATVAAAAISERYGAATTAGPPGRP